MVMVYSVLDLILSTLSSVVWGSWWEIVWFQHLPVEFVYYWWSSIYPMCMSHLMQQCYALIIGWFHACWCYGGGPVDMFQIFFMLYWGFTGAGFPWVVLSLVVVLASHVQTVIPCFVTSGSDVLDANDQIFPHAVWGLFWRYDAQELSVILALLASHALQDSVFSVLVGMFWLLLIQLFRFCPRIALGYARCICCYCLMSSLLTYGWVVFTMVISSSIVRSNCWEYLECEMNQ